MEKQQKKLKKIANKFIPQRSGQGARPDPIFFPTQRSGQGARPDPIFFPYNKLMLHYPFAVYFFTRKENEALALWIEQGLEQMIDDGELLAHMQQQELTRHVFPLQHNSSAPWISIKNPLLSPDTPVTNNRYWFQPQDFKVDGK